jgi:hypothetical protein
MAGKKKRTFQLGKEVRAISRERVGPVPPARPILPKSLSKTPKHKKPPNGDGSE